MILPILYIDFLGDIAAEAESGLIDKCRALQWEDFSELRFEEFSSRAYRTKIGDMAKRLVEANRNFDTARNVAVLEGGDAHHGDPEDDEIEERGVLNQLGEMEATLPRLTNTLSSLSGVTQEIGSVTQETVARESLRINGSFADRLVVSRILANSLDAPSRKFMDLSSTYIEEFRSVDNGVKTLIQLSKDGELGDGGDLILDSILGLAHQTRETFGQLSTLKESVRKMRKWSRELSEPMRRIDVALDQILESQEISDEWINSLEHNSLDL